MCPAPSTSRIEVARILFEGSKMESRISCGLQLEVVREVQAIASTEPSHDILSGTENEVHGHAGSDAIILSGTINMRLDLVPDALLLLVRTDDDASLSREILHSVLLCDRISVG